MIHCKDIETRQWSFHRKPDFFVCLLQNNLSMLETPRNLQMLWICKASFVEARVPIPSLCVECRAMDQSHLLGIVKLRQTVSMMVCRHIWGWLWLQDKEFGLREKISFTEDSVQDTGLLYAWYLLWHKHFRDSTASQLCLWDPNHHQIRKSLCLQDNSWIPAISVPTAWQATLIDGPLQVFAFLQWLNVRTVQGFMQLGLDIGAQCLTIVLFVTDGLESFETRAHCSTVPERNAQWCW
jgi:hypothetical protein